MAHRPMPKPDMAGRLFPVEPAPASNISHQPRSTNEHPAREPRNPRDYWEVILCVLMIAATLVVGWRIARIILHRNTQSQNKTTLATPTLINSAPDSSLKTPASVETHPISPVPHLAKSASNQASDSPVVIQAIVGTDGKVKQAKVIRGNSELAPAALETVRQLSFNPYAPNGTAVEFETEVVVSHPGTHKNPNENLLISIPQQPATQQTSAP